MVVGSRSAGAIRSLKFDDCNVVLSRGLMNDNDKGFRGGILILLMDLLLCHAVYHLGIHVVHGDGVAFDVCL